METYSALDVLEVPVPAGVESLCREVCDSITWQTFTRVPLDARVPHPTTLKKSTERCGPAAVAACNKALLAKAVEANLPRDRVRADTTVVAANVSYPMD